MGGLFRSVLPLLKRGSLAIAKEVLSSGSNLIGDIQEKKPTKESVKKRALETVTNLKQRAINSMTGGGYNPKKRQRITHSKVNCRTSRTSKNKKNKSKAKKRKTVDIFTA